MTTRNDSGSVGSAVRRVWKSAQLYIGFHRDPSGRKRDRAKVWPPKNASASIHADPGEQEAFLVVKSVDTSASEDVQIRIRPDKIVLRRDCDTCWQGVQVDAFSVMVRTADDVYIKIGYDGSVTRQTEADETTVDADGSVFKRTDYAEAHMSGDGVTVSRRTDTHVAAITEDGVVSKLRGE
ncbi:hypothetical protein Q5Y75_16265 [Ruegeria sp. 2205SS24-7]|uniref:hypothetical protein n=1 Tax=Ruegeria discodermiae TaxID=3064389 RepID=UPI0027424709|nr:hypothetical protein [Ruegeria sp. 2205SS24-7]MDP5218785.1 hypothetical protein [Ruegeria sp. 2205SS24-7]